MGEHACRESCSDLLLVRSRMRRALRRSTRWGTCCSSQRAMLSHCRRDRPAMPGGKAPPPAPPPWACSVAPSRLSSRSSVSRVLRVLRTCSSSSSFRHHFPVAATTNCLSLESPSIGFGSLTIDSTACCHLGLLTHFLYNLLMLLHIATLQAAW